MGLPIISHPRGIFLHRSSLSVLILTHTERRLQESAHFEAVDETPRCSERRCHTGPLACCFSNRCHTVFFLCTSKRPGHLAA